MKKNIIILICLIFMSGCSATYQIKIEDNKIEEKLTLIETNQNLFDVQNEEGWTLRQMFESLLTTDSDEFVLGEYSVKSLTNDNQLGVQYYSDSANEIINSSVIHQCYINPTLTSDGNIVTLNTGDDFRCYEYYENLETIKVVLTTNHKVISSNAHLVEDEKYIWNITKDSDKQIKFSYDKTVEENWNIFIIIVAIASLIVVGCISVYMYFKMRNENKI